MSTEKLTTIRLSGQLGKKFGRVHQFYVSSAGEAVRMLAVNFPEFHRYMCDESRKTLYRVFVADKQIDPEVDLHVQTGVKEIRISPVLTGSKRGLFSVVLGAALIGLAFWNPMGWVALGAKGAIGTTVMFNLGLSMALSGVASLISPQPQLGISDAPENTPNKTLDGPVNTISSGRPVPIAYGEVMVGSATISAGVYSSDIAADE